MINFKTDMGVDLKVFTTRADTIYGVTYIAIAPNNMLITSLTTPTQKQQVEQYVSEFNKRMMLSSRNANDDISGVFLGSYAINPLTNQKIPLYAANYVLNSYATGMVMGVPAHDSRDYKFAQLQKLLIVYVIDRKGEVNGAYEDDGIHINSPLINGHNIQESIQIINNYMVKNRLGGPEVSYKLKD
jgi:leucyl-tRNA synthetase